MALLEVLYWYLNNSSVRSQRWIKLAHVCRRWRYIIFASPLRLNLGLLCRGSNPVREMLDIWPPFPIEIIGDRCSEEGADNIIAALEHNDRVCRIYISSMSSLTFGRFARAMQEPFPELKHLTLRSPNETLVFPETFLAGSAPHLRYCSVDYLPFPALRKLLLSASHLVSLYLHKIPHSAYIPPEAMVTCLSAVTNLGLLELRFLSPRSRPDRASRRPPPLIRNILPSLTVFSFHGVSEYLEDFISQIDAPRLCSLDIDFFHQLTLDVSQLHQFINRTETLRELSVANVILGNGHAEVELSGQTPASSRAWIRLSIQCNKSDWQLSFLAQACNSLSPTLSTVETLNIRGSNYQPLRPGWEDDIENSQWLELFHPFTSVKNLDLSWKLVPLAIPALRQLAEEGVADVLPVLQKLSLGGLALPGLIQKDLGQFVAARQHFNNSLTVQLWNGRIWTPVEAREVNDH